MVDDDRLVLATLDPRPAAGRLRRIDTDNGDDAILLARASTGPTWRCWTSEWRAKSGFDVAGLLRHSMQTPFMFLSAFADDDTVAQVKALGAVDYPSSRSEVRQILPAVEAALARLQERPAADAGSAPMARPQGNRRRTSPSRSAS